jgi:hypothetical protein
LVGTELVGRISEADPPQFKPPQSALCLWQITLR